MSDFISALFASVTMGIIGFGLAFAKYHEVPIQECRKAHDVYACEMVAIPVRTEGTKP